MQIRGVHGIQAGNLQIAPHHAVALQPRELSANPDGPEAFPEVSPGPTPLPWGPTLLGLVLLLAATFLALVPTLRLPFTENEGIYGTVAQEMQRGALLYRDVWDHKPPLIYLEYEAVQQVLGTSEQALHLAMI